MSSQLEQYLREVAVQLHELRESEREEQVDEIRAHLLAYAAKLQSTGATENEAIQAAIEQFGEPAKVGRSIRRAEARRYWRLAGPALLFAMAATISLSAAGSHMLNDMILMPRPTVAMRFYVAIANLGDMLLVGASFGLVFRRNALRWVAWYVVIVGLVSCGTDLDLPPRVHVRFFVYSGRLLVGCASVLVHGLLTVAGAWIGARFAERLARRRGVAGG